MHAIQLVSIDLFETLVDASAGRHALWQTFLGGTSTPARIAQAWTLTTQRLFASLDQIIAASTYQPLHAVFQACYMEIFAHPQVAFDPGEAARMGRPLPCPESVVSGCGAPFGGHTAPLSPML